LNHFLVRATTMSGKKRGVVIAERSHVGEIRKRHPLL